MEKSQLLLLTLCVAVSGLQAPASRPQNQIKKSVFGNTCFIRNALARPNEFLELTPGVSSRAVTSAIKGGADDFDKLAQWRIEKWMVDGQSFFELKNRQNDKYLSHGLNFMTRKVEILATRASFAATKDPNNLWEIFPARLNSLVTIKHSRTGKFLFAPKEDGKTGAGQGNVQLGSRTVKSGQDQFKWVITCK